VHANLPAFRAVLDDVAETDADETWCLGDLVGYGAQPDECVALAREACDVCLVGNHDLVVLGKLDMATFSFNAAMAAEWTKQNIAKESLDFLGELGPADTGRQIGLFHASPRDPVWEYVLSIRQASDCLDAQPRRVCLIGHSHVACYFSRPNADSSIDETIGEVATAGTGLDMAEGRWLVNPGSVGQPRDGDPRAAWLMLDTEAWTARFHRVEYSVETAAKAIVDAGLPRQLADRLFAGH
jgi:diadenosine tetraphosphatase ApaH/serine/threonine PP2A family protein phosphatase